MKGVAHSTPYIWEIEGIASGQAAIYVLDPPFLDFIDTHYFVQVASWRNHDGGGHRWTVQGMFGGVILRGDYSEMMPHDHALSLIGYMIGGE